jgi:hypothetical protein
VAADASILTAEDAALGLGDRLNRWSVDLVRNIYDAVNGPAFRVMAAEAMHAEEVARVFEAEKQRLTQPLALYLQRLSADRRFRIRDPDMAAELCMHVLGGIALNQAQREKRDPRTKPEQLVAAFVDLVLNGLLAPDADRSTGEVSTG